MADHGTVPRHFQSVFSKVSKIMHRGFENYFAKFENILSEILTLGYSKRNLHVNKARMISDHPKKFLRRGVLFIVVQIVSSTSLE